MAIMVDLEGNLTLNPQLGNGDHKFMGIIAIMEFSELPDQWGPLTKTASKSTLGANSQRSIVLSPSILAQQRTNFNLVCSKTRRIRPYKESL